MKHGDQVKTPKGLGIFFDTHDKEPTKAYVILQTPTDNKMFVPLIEPGNPVWTSFPCDTFEISELSIDKTLEERKEEARQEAMAKKRARDAELHRRMNEFAQQQRNAGERNQS